MVNRESSVVSGQLSVVSGGCVGCDVVPLRECEL